MYHHKENKRKKHVHTQRKNSFFVVENWGFSEIFGFLLTKLSNVICHHFFSSFPEQLVFAFLSKFGSLPTSWTDKFWLSTANIEDLFRYFQLLFSDFIEISRIFEDGHFHQKLDNCQIHLVRFIRVFNHRVLPKSMPSMDFLQNCTIDYLLSRTK